MLKKFLIISICVCCVISIFGLSNNRWNYEGFQTAIAQIGNESDIVRDDFNTISIISYYWGDRITITNDMYNQGYRIKLLTGYIDDKIALRYVYGIVDPSAPDTGTIYDFVEIINDHTFIYNDEQHARDAYSLMSFILEYSSVLDMSDSTSILTDISFGVVFIVQALASVLAIAYTGIYILIDIFSVSVVVIRSVLWLLGFS